MTQAEEEKKLWTNLMWCEMKWFIFYVIAKILGIWFWEKEKKSNFFPCWKKIFERNERTKAMVK